MTVTCPKCKTRLNLADEKVKAEGTRFRCLSCGAVLALKGKSRRQSSDREEETGSAVPPPSAKIRATMEGETPQGSSIREASGAHPNKDEPLLTLKYKMEAYEKDGVSSPAGEERNKGISGKAIAAAAAAGLVALFLVGVFVFRSHETAPRKQPASVQPAGREAASQLPAVAPSDVSTAVAPPAPAPSDVPAEQMSSSTPEEKAVEMVKRSDVLLKMTTVESIVNKWSQDNAGKYKLIGWRTKKIDEQRYIVSYTALDGTTPRGFYFVANIQDGGVEDLAHNPELQKKYDVQYSR